MGKVELRILFIYLFEEGDAHAFVSLQHSIGKLGIGEERRFVAGAIVSLTAIV
jgi:hypothetical protein